jgi:hypothetical protein
MNINELPDELLFKILEHLLPDKSCDIDEFKNYFLVNTLWCKILNSNTMLRTFSDNNNLYQQFKNEKFTYFSLINRFCIENIIFKINPIFLTTLSINNIINLPVCKFTNSKCIDGLCHLKDSGDCYRNHHSIYDYITSTLMRGRDDIGRIYFLFCYKKLNTKKYHYEFIYHKSINDDIFLTFSGEFNKTYIGMISENKEFDPDYIYEREINIFSYKYINKLINNENCGVPIYDCVTHTFNESDKEFISLYL